jgi:ketosteroid isomerase-like protein
MIRTLLFAAALSACASGPSAELPSAAPVIAAERAFASRAGEIAWIPAFREFVAPDGQMARPEGYIDAPAQLASAENDGNRNLFWWPAFAGISRSGDFGFTTGPVSFDEQRTPRMHYFTVWRRQPDGSWKWIYDGGVGQIAEPNLNAPGGDVQALPTSNQGTASAEAAVAEVRALEGTGGLASRLADDAQVFRTRERRSVGADAPAAFSALGQISYEPLRVEASDGGDLVMVLGSATWTADGQPARGQYARIWQYRADGWRIVYHQLSAQGPPPSQG